MDDRRRHGSSNSWLVIDAQLTNIPDEIDQAIRERAAAEHQSPEQTILEALARGLGLSEPSQKKRDLSGIAGACTIDDRTRAAFEEQRASIPNCGSKPHK